MYASKLETDRTYIMLQWDNSVTPERPFPDGNEWAGAQLPSSPIAREAIARTVTSAMRPSAIINNLARVVIGMASAGLNAAAVQKARYK